jgi:hypothetical protein
MNQTFLQGIFSGVIAIACAVLSAIVIFFAPVLIYGSYDIFLIWGWIALFVVIPSAFAIGWFVKAGLDRAISTLFPHRITLVNITSILLLTACGYFVFTFGDVNLTWTEQMTLSDGSLLMVKRGVVGNSFGRSRIRPEDWLPSSFSIDVSKSFSGVPIWRAPLRPILLDLTMPNGNIVIVAEPKDCSEWIQIGKPNPPYFAYELQDHMWTQVEVPLQFLGRSANLLRAPRFTGEQTLIRASDVEQRNNAGPHDAWPVVRVFDRYC